MPTADLLTRARNAVTVEEECDVIDDYAAGQAIKGLAPENLLSLTEDVRYGLYPRAVLLGVVAALVPRRDAIHTVNLQIWPNYSGTGRDEADASLCDWIDTGPSVEEPVLGKGSGGTPALALLIAIMEAGNAEA